MNIQTLKQSYINKNTQFVVFSIEGQLLGSCDTLFKVKMEKDTLFEEVPFLASMVEALFDMAEGEELTFPCIGEDLYGNEGYFDFVFNKQKYQGKEAMLWIIHDFSEHYEHLISLQQQRNESEIKGEFLETEKKNIQLENELLEYKNAELERLQQIKSRFFSNISHELRTPLNGIYGLANLIDGTGDKHKLKEYTEALNATVVHLTTMVNDILDHSKIEAGKITFVKEPFDLRATLRTVSNSFLFACREKGIDLQVNLSFDLPRVIVGDATKLSQILYNLLGNAVKFTDKGSIRLEVSLLSMQESCTELQFSISDTGIGIAKEKLEKIFAPYEQATDHTSRLFGGTGLGLNIVKQLVELQGGSIRVDSSLGHGTEFVLSIRYEGALKEKNPEPYVSSEASSSSDPTGKILIGEDDTLQQKMLHDLLLKWGYEVSTVGTGKQVMEVLANTELDVLLLDYHMPEMDGYQVASAIRASSESYAHIPIIILTGEQPTYTEGKFQELNIQSFVTKPVLPDELHKMIRRVLTDIQKDRKGRVLSMGKMEVDLSYLIDVMDGDMLKIKELAEIFLSSAPQQISKMHDLYDKKDWHSLQSLVHQSKSNYKYIGILSVGELLDELEQDLKKERNQEGYLSKIEQVEKATHQAVTHLKQMRWSS